MNCDDTKPMGDLMLPLLPEPELFDIALEKAEANGVCPVISYYTADQMREYARKAAASERERCVGIIEAHRIPVGNSAAGEMACEWTYAALREIRDAINGTAPLD